ncbi:hypothetical protein KAI46_03390, partial [bacterium]|nr:hypothetical protein [bacterium]
MIKKQIFSKRSFTWLLLTFALLLGSPQLCQATDAAFANLPVTEIVVLGNQKVTKDTITDKMQTKRGDQLSLETLNQDLKDLYSLGFFDNLMINLKTVGEGVEVALIVVEKPTISAIVIKGNDKVKRKELLKEITLHTFSILNDEKLLESLEKMKAFYREKGFYSVRIKTKTTKAGKNRAQVIFIVDEGPKCYIKKINFNGNDNFSSWSLRRKLQTKTYSFFLSWITDAGILNQAQLENDAKIIKSFYLSEGYVKVRVSQPKITLDENRKWIYVDFNVEEGEVFTMGKVEVVDPESAPEVTDSLVMILKGRSGETFSNLNLQSDIETLSTYFADRGHAFVDIDPQTKIDSEKRQIDVSYHINQGTKFLFGRINIAGNTKTR